MAYTSHVKKTFRTAFYHLHNIAKIQHTLSQVDAEKVVNAFVISRLDYCNSPLSGCPNKFIKTLHLVQNTTAHILTRISKRDHISPGLASLYWLPIKFRIEYKISLFTHKALNGQAPS